MVIPILAILAAISTPIAYWWMKRLKKQDDPFTLRQKQKNEINKAIATGDSDCVNKLLDGVLEK